MGEFKFNKSEMKKLEKQIQKELSNIPVQLEGSEDDAARALQKELKKRGVTADHGDALDMVRQARKEQG